MFDATKVYEKLIKIYECKNLKEFSLKIGKSANWASQMRKSGTVPTDLCIETSQKYNVSIDWLLLDKEPEKGPEITKKEFINNVKECFYECWELDLLPDYPKESISAISILFMNNFGEMINISREKESFKEKKRSI